MITTGKVTKYFGNTEALKNISFEINQGEIVGFLGPNGAGKTTLMRILTCYLPPTSGKASVCGYDIIKNSLRVRKNVGYLPETPPLYPNMTVYEYLKFAAQLKDIPTQQIRIHIDRVLEECHLTKVQRKTIQTLSKGYKQRVGIAQAIIHNPAVLILDEPTSGLDPVQILQVRNLIKGLEQKRTVILSTHILSEIEQMAQRVIIIKSGRIITDRLLKDLLTSSLEKEKYILRIQGQRQTVEKALQAIENLSLINFCSESLILHQVEVEIPPTKGIKNFLIKNILQSGCQMEEIRASKPSLEEVFLKLISEEER